MSIDVCVQYPLNLSGMHAATDTNIKEVQRRVFELTLALYRVTDFFPQGEVLRKNLREKANEIFGFITEYGYSGGEQDATFILSKIQSVGGYLELARSLRFVRPINITVLEREYNFLADFFAPHPSPFAQQAKGEGSAARSAEEELPMKGEGEGPTKNEITEEPLPTWEEFSLPPTEVNNVEAKDKTDGLTHIQGDLNSRQKTILEHLKDTKQAKISHFYSIFNDISSKTIQRDLQDLVGRNMLKKEGEKRWTVYSLN